MRAVFKKEFRSVLLSNAGISFIGLFLCFVGSMIAYWNLSQQASAFEVIFAYLPFAALVLIPLLTIGAFSKERREGTDRFLALMPLSNRDIALGKYLSRLVIAMLPNVVMLFIPLVLDLFGDVNYITAYVVIFVFSILEALLLAISLYIDTIFKRRYFAMSMPYVILAALFVIGVVGKNIPVSDFVTKVLSTVLLKISPFSLFEEFLYGIVDFSVIFVYLSFTLLFVALTVLAFGKKNGSYAYEDNKNTAERANRRVISLVMAGAVLFANICVLVTPAKLAKIDITPERTYTLSEETKEFLDSLDKDVTLYIIDLEESEYRVKLFLDRMAAYSSHLSVREIDSKKDTEFCEKYGLEEFDSNSLTNSIIVESDARYSMIYLSSLFTYTNEKFGFERISASEFPYYYSVYSSSTEYAEYVNALLSETDMYFEGQTVIPQYIEYVAADYIPSVYVLGGHGAGISNSLFYELSVYYGLKYKTLELTEGAEVPMDVSSLIIARPETDLSESEANAIKKYLSQGGQITVLTEENNLSMKNLMSVLAAYGMTANSAILTETKVTKGEGDNAEETITETTDLTVKPNEDHDIMADISSQINGFVVTVDKSNAITLNAGADESLLLTPLLTTSENAYFAGDDTTKGVYTVAATAERASGDRVVWFTGAASILGIGDVSLMNEQQISDTMTAVLAVSWTNNVYKSVLTSAPATCYTARELQITETAATVLGMILVAIIPAAVAGCIAIVRYKREKA